MVVFFFVVPVVIVLILFRVCSNSDVKLSIIHFDPRWKRTQPAGTRALLHVTGRLVFTCLDRCRTSSGKGVHICMIYIDISNFLKEKKC